MGNRTPTLSLYDHHISRLSNPIHRKQSQICHKQLSTSASRIDQPLQKPPGPINHCAHAGPNPPRSGPFTSYLPPTNPQNVPRPPLKRVFAPPKRLQSPPRPHLRPLHKHDPNPHPRAPTIRLPLLRDPGRIVRGREAGFVKGLTKPGECLFVSTDKGVLEARECVERKVGGMLLCRVL